MNKITNIRDYSFSGNDDLFLDTNVWLSIYGPLTRRRSRATAYSRAIKNIQLKNCNIHVDEIVLSEFINAFAQWEFKQTETEIDNFKEFRSTEAFIPIAEEIKQAAKRILKQCKIVDNAFHRFNVYSFLDEYGKGKSDFNDLLIAEVCKTYGFTLITDDGDFKGNNVAILTANNRLLN